MDRSLFENRMTPGMKEKLGKATKELGSAFYPDPVLSDPVTAILIAYADGLGTAITMGDDESVLSPPDQCARNG